MDGKAFIEWLLLDVLHKSQDMGAAAGPSECPLLCSCEAGNVFSFQRRASAVLCGTVQMGKQGNYSSIPCMKKNCKQIGTLSGSCSVSLRY